MARLFVSAMCIGTSEAVDEQESVACNGSCLHHGTQHTWSELTQVPSQSKP